MAILERRLADGKIALNLTDEAKDLLARAGFDPVYGARPLKRTIQHKVQDPLAMKILEGAAQEGETVTVDAEGDEIVFR